MPVIQNDAANVDGGLDTPYAAAGIVLGSLLALWLIRRGFRGVAAGGVSLSVK